MSIVLDNIVCNLYSLLEYAKDYYNSHIGRSEIFLQNGGE